MIVIRPHSASKGIIYPTISTGDTEIYLNSNNHRLRKIIFRISNIILTQYERMSGQLVVGIHRRTDNIQKGIVDPTICLYGYSSISVNALDYGQRIYH